MNSNILYCPFDRLHSMIGLVKTDSGGHIALKGRSNDPEMKIMLISSAAGGEVNLRSVFDELSEKAMSSDGELLVDTWINIGSNMKFYFQSIQNTRCEVKSRLCRYTAFSYILRNGQIEVYDSDTESVTHKAYVDITMPVFYSITQEKIPVKRFLKKIEMVDSGYCRVKFECDNIDLYKTGYIHIEYMGGEIKIPVTPEMVQNGFFLKESKIEPEIKTEHKELIDLRRR